MSVFKSIMGTFLLDFLHNMEFYLHIYFAPKKVGSGTVSHKTFLPSLENLKKNWKQDDTKGEKWSQKRDITGRTGDSPNELQTAKHLYSKVP